MSRKAFTLVEIMIAITCLAIIVIPVYSVLRSGSQTSLKGMKRVETTLEARKILKQVYADLKMLCFNFQDDLDSSKTYSFDDTLYTNNKTIPDTVIYSFNTFPSNQELDEIFDGRIEDGDLKANTRNINHIKYTIESNDNQNNPCYKFVREVTFKGKTTKKVLSERVNYFEIKPISVYGNGKMQYYYYVSLQLIDTINNQSQIKNVHNIGEQLTAEHDNNIILADFFDVVYPEYFHAAWNQSKVVPNWHNIISD